MALLEGERRTVSEDNIAERSAHERCSRSSSRASGNGRRRTDTALLKGQFLDADEPALLGIDLESLEAVCDAPPTPAATCLPPRSH